MIQATSILNIRTLICVIFFGTFTKMSPPPRGSLSNAPMLHLHIPKTAGTALAVYMQNNWSRRCAQVKLNKQMFGTPLTSTPANALITTDLHADCYWVTVHSGPDGSGWPLISILTMRQGVKFRYAHGHIGFGACKFLQAGCQYTTVLREPRNRLLSHYFYLREAHPNISMITCQGCDTFKGFLKSLLARKSSMYGSENFYARMLYGDAINAVTTNNVVCKQHLSACDIIPFMNVNETHFKKVKENLRNHFPVIGILEDIQTYQALMLYHYNYLPYPIEILRKTQCRLQVDDLDDETLGMMDQFLQWDMKIYEFARELVAKRVAELETEFQKCLANVTKFTNDGYHFLQKWNDQQVYKGSEARNLIQKEQMKR
eukprot:TRINITY_DN844_c1_g1_i14.p1 TRINITY_DN844_c1_g1~~TRINITY_DN844_c1_g1_i14.p1  ORF type:complete len:373 (-),score=1.47 TRINITY_DN844_c1_g1_i14:305-1423(-)